MNGDDNQLHTCSSEWPQITPFIVQFYAPACTHHKTLPSIKCTARSDCIRPVSLHCPLQLGHHLLGTDEPADQSRICRLTRHTMSQCQPTASQPEAKTPIGARRHVPWDVTAELSTLHIMDRRSLCPACVSITSNQPSSHRIASLVNATLGLQHYQPMMTDICDGQKRMLFRDGCGHLQGQQASHNKAMLTRHGECLFQLIDVKLASAHTD